MAAAVGSAFYHKSNPVQYSDGSTFVGIYRIFGLWKTIEMTTPEGTVVHFNRTNRDDTRMVNEYLYPASFVAPSSLKGKRVLDTGCGDGNYVYKLRRLGVDAIGSDAFLWPGQKKYPYFVEASSFDLPFHTADFDVVFSTWSSIGYQGSYTEPERMELIVKLLGELARVTKPGGKIRISPVPFRYEVTDAGITPTYPELEAAIAELGNLTISQAADRAWLAQAYYAETISPRDPAIRVSASAWVEITKSLEN
jgi:SAM-dependent methyltransferase